MDVRPLPTERDPEAARLLAEAFLDYPTWVAVAPRSSVRRRAMVSRYYEAELAVARRRNGTTLAAFDGQRLAGVALAFDPDRHPQPWWSLLWFGPLLLAGPSGVARALRALSAMDSSHPATPHLYLHTVGADPGNQRRGVGRALVSQVTDRADQQRWPAYLMTSRGELLDYYRGFDFEPTGQLTIPRGVTVWGLLREPG